MQALVGHRVDGEGRAALSEVPTPTAGPGKVLVRVRAAGLNPIDERIVRSRWWRIIYGHRLPVVLGHDFSGVVEQAGPGARFAVGAEVFGRPHERRIGTIAELLAVREEEIAAKPKRLSHEDAASIPLVALTAWQALVDRARVVPGHRVMITAGSGGFGTFAIQLAKHLGAWVATTASERNADLVRNLGADEVIDYHRVEFESVLRDIDVVIDGRAGSTPAGSQPFLQRSLAIVRPGGCLVSLNGPPDARMSRELDKGRAMRWILTRASAGIRRAAQRRGVRYEPLFVQPSGEQLGEIAGLLEAGVIRPVIDRVFPFARAAEALDAMAAGRARGKIVIAIDGADAPR